MRFGLRELIFLMVLLSVPIASFIFVFKPRNDEIRQANNEIEMKTEKLEKLREISSRIEDIGSAIEEWSVALEEVEGKLPSEQGIDAILEEVWTLAETNGLQILATRAEAALPAGSYMELPLKIEMTGNFDGFYQFMLELEQLQRITRIHQLKINKPGAGKGGRRTANKADGSLAQGAMEAQFTLSIYYESSNMATAR